MAGGHLEVERKYSVPDNWQMPDLAGLPGVRIDPPAELDLDAAYLDTEDLRLLRSGATLRRRHGGHDEGWHLKLPSGGERLELQRPLDRDASPDDVPQELVALSRGRARGQPLVPVARLRTRRLSHMLRDQESGDVLAEVTDDEVTAEVPGAGSGGASDVNRWREVEAELVAGDESLLDDVEELLLSSGAEASAERSKVGHALESRLAALSEPAASGGAGTGSDLVRAVDPVLAYVRAQVHRLAATDAAIRLRQPDGVHDMRVATRRLRSVLKSFHRFFEPGTVQPLRDELAWLADGLGHARDAEVLREELMTLLDGQPAELVLGSVAQRLDDELSATRQAAVRAVDDALDSERYLALLRRLDEFLAEPPLSGRGEKKPQRALRKAVRRDWRRVARRGDAVDAATARLEVGTTDGEGGGAHVDAVPGLVDPATGADGTDCAARDRALHEMRKAAKRGRYTGELVAAGLEGTGSGSDAADFASALERMQDVLGQYQDSVVARAELRRLGIEAHLAGENAFTFGRLHALEERRGDAALAQLEEVERRAEKAAEQV